MYVYVTLVFNIPRMSSQHPQHHQLGFLPLRMLKRGVGPPHDGKSEDSSTGAIPVKHLKRSGGVGAAAAPAMMIEKVMIQLGPTSLKSSGGVGGWGGGGGGSPPSKYSPF